MFCVRKSIEYVRQSLTNLKIASSSIFYKSHKTEYKYLNVNSKNSFLISRRQSINCGVNHATLLQQKPQQKMEGKKFSVKKLKGNFWIETVQCLWSTLPVKEL